MIGASVLLSAGTQPPLWAPYGPGSGEQLPEPDMMDESGIPEEEMMEGMMEDMGAPPGSPPQAILTSARRNAVGLEGTFCWAPAWADNCVEDAGIPLPEDHEALAVKQGEAVDLAFVLRSSEGEFNERNPEVTGTVAYPLDQETKTISSPPETRYLVPDGSRRELTKEPLDVKGGAGLKKVTANVPEGEYIFQVTAQSPEPPGEVESWLRAQYHFRVKVLP